MLKRKGGEIFPNVKCNSQKVWKCHFEVKGFHGRTEKSKWTLLSVPGKRRSLCFSLSVGRTSNDGDEGKQLDAIETLFLRRNEVPGEVKLREQNSWKNFELQLKSKT